MFSYTIRRIKDGLFFVVKADKSDDAFIKVSKALGVTKITQSDFVIIEVKEI